MKWFVIILAVMFLNVVLFIDLWQYFVGPEYRTALPLVPILLLANIFLGIYYNLTVWYKLTDKTHFGAYIMMIGAVVTLAFNWLLIPSWGYHACAWGTLLCYSVMMYLSYTWGQKYYPIPYNLPRLFSYLGFMLLLFAIALGVRYITDSNVLRISIGAILFASFFWLVYRKERQELKGFPVLGRFIK